MKYLNFFILKVFYFLFFYLSFEDIYYHCINIGKPQINTNGKNVNSNEKANNLSTEWSNRGFNFMDLLKNGYLQSHGNLEEVKDELANELANKIQNKIGEYLKDEKNLSVLQHLQLEDLDDLKYYVKDVSEYIGSKAGDLLDQNLENTLKPLLERKSFETFEQALHNKNTDNFVPFEENDKSGNANEETEKFVDELVEEYENTKNPDLEEQTKDIKTHSDSD
ncbi:male development gene 1 [Plasmodium reichenowi]|uniref:Male development gene 1 n=1 Tax=Plasmodium reichenowi TaxID=5854 RepID=A0A2P9DHW8_PLARE|nr:male development gene 1 [Plasmodium reichenowi]